MRSVLVAAGLCACALVAESCSNTPPQENAAAAAGAGTAGAQAGTSAGGTRPLPDGGAGLGGRGAGGGLVVIPEGGAGTDGEGGAPPTCEGEPTCEAYCANANAPRECTSPAGLEPCLDFCENRIAQYLPEDCLDEWATFLGCASCQDISCEVVCMNGVCYDPPFMSRCDDFMTAVRTCAGSCLLTHEGGHSEPGNMSHYLAAHCECPAELLPGGADGEPCADYGDCAEVCCACSASDGRYVARQCRSGQCVGAPELCEIAESELGISMFCAGEGGL